MILYHGSNKENHGIHRIHGSGFNRVEHVERVEVVKT